MQTVFLEWNRPLLESAVDFLLQKFSIGGRLDMSSAVLALPSSRAMLRLEELLLERTESLTEAGKIDSAWFPPRLLTVGGFPETLYVQKKPVADDLVQIWVWINVLDEMYTREPDILARVLPHYSSEDDLETKLALARVFAQLHRELAAETLEFNDVAQKCREFGVIQETMRWETLAEIQVNYLAKLDALGLWDLQTARIFAIKHAANEIRCDNLLILVGAVDLNTTQKRFLDALKNEQVLSLVFSPDSMRNRFDHYGCVIPNQWKDAKIDIPDTQIEVVDTPGDQAVAVAVWLAKKIDRLKQTERHPTSEDISIGVPDDNLVPLVRQQIRQAGASSRHVAGIRIKQTGPYKFLESIAALVEQRRFSDFADLLRHPDTQEFLTRTEPGKIDPAQLLTESDRYHNKFLPHIIDGNWREYIDETAPNKFETFDSLKTAWTVIEKLLAPFFRNTNEKQSLSVWRDNLAFVMNSVFPETGLAKHYSDAAVAEIESVVAKIAELPVALVSGLDAKEFLVLLISQLQSVRIAPQADRDAIEILGWLELAFDDSPIMGVLCMNEGIVPSSTTGDLFLPDRIRSELKIEDNDRRLVRDAYALSVLLAIRSGEDNIRLIAGRRSGDATPQLPSRLLFACEPTKIAERVVRFFEVEEKPAPVVFPGTLQCGSDRSMFNPPQPKPLIRKTDSMRVTEFKDYIACPYRYYLRHKLRLDVLRDENDELDAAMFGNLAHEVLRRFGIGPCKYSENPDDIAAFLSDMLSTYSAELYGEKPRSVIAIQTEQLRTRLEVFAIWQAVWTRSGNRIKYTELSLHEPNSQLETGATLKSYLKIGDENLMKIRGRIDRIDVNEQTGQWYVFDYKSFDGGKSPKDVHLSRGKWVDLQLPLYHHIMLQSREAFPGMKSLEVGYLVFPKDPTKSGALIADWDDADFARAIETAKEVAINIQAEKFGPEFMSKTPPAFSEIYSPITLDKQWNL